MNRGVFLGLLFIALTHHTASTAPRISQLPDQTGVDPSLPVTYFGGTTWNPDSLRWEAVRDSVWTFDSGVGSHFNHLLAGTQPKDISLHALMEGWLGLNFNAGVHATHQLFRRLGESDFAGAPHVCVGDVAGLGGDYSFWAGLLPAEAAQYNFMNPMGYGNYWVIRIQKAFYYGGSGSVQLAFDYSNDTEEGFDYTYLSIQHSGGEASLRSYTGRISGHESILLQPGLQLPAAPDTILIRYQVVTDCCWSDEDGLYESLCGAFAVDDIELSGAIQDLSSFETGEDGWTVVSSAPPNAYRDWSNIVALSDLPPLESAPCALRDSVLVFTNLEVGGHLNGENNIAVSPWIDLKAAGLVGAPQKLITFDVYGEPILGGGYAAPGAESSSCPGANNTVFVQVGVQWFPYWFEDGTVGLSPWMWGGSLNFKQPQCSADNAPSIFDVSPGLYAGAEQVRVGLGVWRDCFPNLGSCPCQHPSPYFDNVRFGVVGEGIPAPPAEASPSFDLSWGSPGNGPGQFTRPLGIAVDDQGNVFVSDRHRIQKFTGSGVFIKSWGDSGVGSTQFNQPTGLSIDGDGHLYVADVGNRRVQKFTTEGRYLFSWSTRQPGDDEDSGPTSLATDSQGHVYVVDSRIKMFSARGQFLTSWGSRSGDIDVGPDGRVYLADGALRTVTVFSPEHSEDRRWRSAFESDTYPNPDPYPGALCVKPNGVVCIGDRALGHVTGFSSEGLQLNQWGSKGTRTGEFIQIGDMALDPSGRYLYVTDYTANRVQRFSYSPVAVPENMTPMQVLVLPPVPNPARGQTSIVLRLPQASEHDVRAEVFNLSGRRVAGLPSRRLSGGEQKLVWDGTTETGTRVGAGLYMFRVEVDGHSAGTVKVIYFPN